MAHVRLLLAVMILLGAQSFTRALKTWAVFLVRNEKQGSSVELYRAGVHIR